MSQDAESGGVISDTDKNLGRACGVWCSAIAAFDIGPEARRAVIGGGGMPEPFTIGGDTCCTAAGVTGSSGETATGLLCRAGLLMLGTGNVQLSKLEWFIVFVLVGLV